MSWLLLLIPALVIALLVYAKKASHDRIRAMFNLDRRYRIKSTDLGKKKGHLYRACGLAGVPDVVFESGITLIVGEYKSRKAGRGPSKYETYQVCLYAGILQKLHPTKRVTALIRYADKVVPVPFSQDQFNWLLSLKEDCRSAARL